MRNWKDILRSRIFLLVFCLFAFLSVLLAFLFPKTSKYDFNLNVITGKVLSYKIDGDLLSFIIKGREKVQVFYYFSSEKEKESILVSFGYGVEVTVKGCFEEPKESTIPNTFDYKEYLYYKNIFYIFKADSLFVEKPSVGISSIKYNLFKKIESMKHGDYLLMMLFGNSSFYNNEILQKNGISHLFSISGMHISLIIFGLSFFFPKSRSKQTVFILFLLLFYLYLVGFSPSALRSYFMWLLRFLNNKFDMGFSSRKLFLLVLIIFLIFNPFILKNIAFQYSFLISFFLLYLKPSKNYFKGIIKISLLSFFVALPITAMNYFEVNFLSILWNLFFVPFVSFVIFPLCFLVLVFPFLTFILSIVLNLFEIINYWLSTVKVGMIIIPYLPFLFWIVYYLILFNVVTQKRKIFIGMFLTIIIAGKFSVYFDERAYVYFIDVGQGDSTLFVAPFHKEVFLIDTGGKIPYHTELWRKRENEKSMADTIVLFLHSLGISNLNSLIITHGDVDHGGNAIEIMSKINIDALVLNHNNFTSLEKELLKESKKFLVSNFESKQFLVEEFTQNSFDENDASLIYKITTYNASFLMMGDASTNIESRLLDRSVESMVLKVGHHGSKNSNSFPFLKKVDPSFAVISAGNNNRYGHPDLKTIESLNQLDISILNTINDGTIWFEVGKKKMKIHSTKGNT